MPLIVHPRRSSRLWDFEIIKNYLRMLSKVHADSDIIVFDNNDFERIWRNLESNMAIGRSSITLISQPVCNENFKYNLI